MATLTQTAIIARKIIRYSIYVLVALIVGRIFINLGVKAYKVWFPAPPAAPTVGFGKLPEMKLPNLQSENALSVKIETPDGRLPTLPRLIKVYFMPKPTPNLLSLDVAGRKASSLGFASFGRKISETVYQFPNTRSPSELTMNIVSGNFSISYDVNANPGVINAKPLSPEKAAQTVRSFFSSAGVLPEDMTGPFVHQLLKIENGNLSPVVSLSEANLVKISLYRKSFDGYASLPGNLSESNIWAIVSGDKARENQILSSEYHYQSVNEEQYETYPVKTVDQAYEDLLSGKAGIARLKGTDKSSQVTIRRVYMAYFDPPEESDFFQPIVVFEGDVGESFGSFVAYVPAVTDEYYGE